MACSLSPKPEPLNPQAEEFIPQNPLACSILRPQLRWPARYPFLLSPPQAAPHIHPSTVLDIHFWNYNPQSCTSFFWARKDTGFYGPPRANFAASIHRDGDGDGHGKAIGRRCLPPRIRRLGSMRKSERLVWEPKKSNKRKESDPLDSSSNSSSAALGPPYPPRPRTVTNAGKTTVMIRNIPNLFRREAFLEFLDEYCRDYQLEYDFLYLPMDFITNNNLGYAFVNFTTASAANRIGELLNNYKWNNCKKICEITWANIQGKEKLVRHFQKEFRCSNDEYLPVLFSPPRNGSTTVTEPKTVGNCRAKQPLAS